MGRNKSLSCANRIGHSRRVFLATRCKKPRAWFDYYSRAAANEKIKEAKFRQMVDWPQIVKDHGPLVWQAVYRIVRQEADAADCFQNTFIAVLDLSRRQTIRYWPALLKRVATMQALNRLAQRGREARRAQPLAADFDVALS